MRSCSLPEYASSEKGDGLPEKAISVPSSWEAALTAPDKIPCQFDTDPLAQMGPALRPLFLFRFILPSLHAQQSVHNRPLQPPVAPQGETFLKKLS
jgi:hypothetical protein